MSEQDDQDGLPWNEVEERREAEEQSERLKHAIDAMASNPEIMAKMRETIAGVTGHIQSVATEGFLKISKDEEEKYRQMLLSTEVQQATDLMMRGYFLPLLASTGSMTREELDKATRTAHAHAVEYVNLVRALTREAYPLAHKTKDEF